MRFLIALALTATLLCSDVASYDIPGDSGVLAIRYAKNKSKVVVESVSGKVVFETIADDSGWITWEYGGWYPLKVNIIITHPDYHMHEISNFSVYAGEYHMYIFQHQKEWK